ncbi:MAG TPA: potassium channel family protein [Sphingomicrobium sp.]|nr:potassium channel family protein [Sphingomicrobium sp.]
MPIVTGETITLRRRPRVRGWAAIVWRALLLISLLVLMIGVHWLEREGLRDELDGHVSFLDVVYFTMISATTTGYGDIVPVSNNTRLFDALVVTPIRVLFLLIFIGSAYMFVARRSWEKFLMRRIQRGLEGHTILAGFGTKNRRALEELIKLGADTSDIVVIDSDEERLDIAKELGCNVMRADAARDETLRAVHVERARLMLISAGRDDTSILICLTARHLAPDVLISIAINEQDNEAPARRAGADIVVNPLNFAGLLLATSHGGQHIADYLGDLASIGGKVQLIERPVRPEEVGKPLRDVADAVGLRLIRDGIAYGFWRPQAAKLEAGDVIMEIKPTDPNAPLPTA